jgi:elongation factor G
LKNDYNIPCAMGKIQISYKETITENSRFEYTYEKTASGKSYFAKLNISIMPNERGEGNVVEFDLKTDLCIPNIDQITSYKEFIKEGFNSSLMRGGLLGSFFIYKIRFPMEDVKISVLGAEIRTAVKRDITENSLQYCSSK